MGAKHCVNKGAPYFQIYEITQTYNTIFVLTTSIGINNCMPLILVDKTTTTTITTTTTMATKKS